MVWDHDVRVIVMLTAESEGGQLKCHPYWRGKDFGPIRLRVLSEKKVSLDIDKRRSPPNTSSAGTDGSSAGSTQSPPVDTWLPEGSRRRAATTTTLDSSIQGAAQFSLGSQAAMPAEPPHVVIRKFALSHAAHPFAPIREITQLHYPSWPDFGAPAQPSHLLALVELANVMQRATLPVDVSGMLASAARSQQNGEAAAAPFGHRGGPDRRAAEGGVPLSWQDKPESAEHARPMLVHCSAGCGRTGAFCTVDTVIDMLKRQRQHALNKTNSSNAAGDSSRTMDWSSSTKGTTTLGGGLAGGAPQPPRRRPSSSDRDRDSDGDIAMDDDQINGRAAASAVRGTHAQQQQPQPQPQRDNKTGTGGGGDGIDVNWLDDDSLDLIAQTVEDFRGQRLSMVQSLRQFVLCYETILEWIWRLEDSGGGGGGGGGGLDARGRSRSGSLAF